MRSFALVGGIAAISTLPACIDVDFSGDGAGGSGTTTATVSSSDGGATSSTSTSATGGAGPTTTTTATGTTTGMCDCANKRCGDDGCGGLCNGVAMQPSWSVPLQNEARSIVPWPETQSVLVTTDGDDVYRIDECDGSVMATMTGVSSGARPYLLASGRFDSTLLVLGAKDASGSSPNELFALDATLAGAPAPPDFLSGEFTTSTRGGFADASGLYVNLGNGGMGRLSPTDAACSDNNNAYAALVPRGIVHTATATYLSKLDTSTRYTTLVKSCAAGCNCQGADAATTSTALMVLHGIADAGSAGLVAVGAAGGINSSGYLVHVDPTTVELGVALAHGAMKPEVLMDVAVSGGYVFAGGAGALTTSTPILETSPSGVGLLLRVPVGFTATEVPLSLSVPSAARVRKVAVDESGVYAGGARSTGGGMQQGFLIKCTVDYDCGTP
jgi:hypothetical protein